MTMTQPTDDWLVRRFEEQRPRLRALAYRMLGSLAEADDAVQEAWLRVSRADANAVENFGGWLTTIVARVCLNSLRARSARQEEPLDGRLPDPVVSLAAEGEPEQQALLADSVGLALQIVLDTLPPAERLAFVLHDIFELPFEDIAPIVGRTPAAARQLASRGRRRVNGAELRRSGTDAARHRRGGGAFFSAPRAGGLERLFGLLDPPVALPADLRADRPRRPPTLPR